MVDMTSFAQSLQSYRNGELALEALLRDIDSRVTGQTGNIKGLLGILTEENARDPLPPQTYEIIENRIRGSVQDGGTQKITQFTPSAKDGIPENNNSHDDEQTKLAPAYVPSHDLPEQKSATIEATALAELLDEFQVSGANSIKGTGDVLNQRFDLKECLGSGGMSTVYKALDRRKLEANDRHPYVAVKVLNQDFRAHPDSLIALQREAKKSLNLSHPNIVRVYDFDRDGDTVFMTMEYLRGDSLERRIKKPGFKGMATNEALRIIADMGKALSFAHENGIVHSDFKPGNVFLTDKGGGKVIDFGIARAFRRPEDSASMEVTRFDPGSLGALTPSYASPEMLEYKEPDPRDDIYALACTAFEMLTGQHPFKRMQANMARDAGFKLKKPAGLSRKQWKALEEALAFKREQRTATVAKFLEQIGPPSPTKSRRAGLISGLLGFFVLIGMGLGYYFIAYDVPAPTKTKGGEQALTIPIPPPPKLSPDSNQPQATEDNTAQSETITSIYRPPEPAPIAAQSLTPIAPAITLESITPLLQRLPCAAVHGSVNDATVTLSGFAKQADIDRLERELQALSGLDRLNSAIEPIDNINCEIIELISPYWKSNKQRQLGTSIQPQKQDPKFSAGEYLVLDIESPSYDAYVTIDYFSLDGGVIHMLPNIGSPNNLAPAHYAATLGDLEEWRVGEPFGTEMIVFLASSEPLFDSPRTEYEPQSDYLPEFKQRLSQLLEKVGPDRITADLLLITTSP
ncbi:MAG: serine/threonine-protein kinase [Pseudomonadota bacterium]